MTLSNDAERTICAVSHSGPRIPAEERDQVSQHASRLSGKISLMMPDSGQGTPVETVLPRAHGVAGT